MLSGDFSIQSKLALLCDYALTSQDGKVSVMGIFSNIALPALPANYPRFFVVAILLLDPGQHSARIQLVSPSGAEMLPNAPSMNLDVPAPASETNLIIGFDNILFESAGLHQVQLRIGAQLAVTIPFTVTTVTLPDTPFRGNA
jgi:hypothetical protein